MKTRILICILSAVPILGFAQIEWKLDPNHSSRQFKVRHMGISEVVGKFDDFNIQMSASDDFSKANIRLEAKTYSINTGVNGRDKHLRSNDFFGVEQFPTLVFESSQLRKKSDQEFDLIGDLTMKGIKKEIILDLTHVGTVTRQNGSVKAGFKVTGELNRMDFGIIGGSTVSDMVQIEGNIQMTKQ